MDLVDTDVPAKPPLAARLTRVLLYVAVAAVVSWRAWSYQFTSLAEPYPIAAVVMSACLVAVLYTLCVMTLAGRSELLTQVVVAGDGERDGASRRRAAGRATA